MYQYASGHWTATGVDSSSEFNKERKIKWKKKVHFSFDFTTCITREKITV